ncbi:ACP phosphodiesterase [Acetobacter nitrogenifigens DSM 23921 = NBRC 105050]|uniref:FMN dependent NADH:quinone oxidoreductase n=1 Tax=Acetobacter nitrogenifigens DSM 23921 = NBRC 105050 TaxID=1120919 RepID=A0A511XEI6_9PROT|nr:NAD(P)H-dependent oxidoreductase [Acetobacter nitrogenifigens]GBQ92279.1 ACP phosphodiesterase [Acetobacter nitrogenifigens DSM 23921 = NBRC 105050]GEN61295.1 FMN-dependent NADH-azoreductase [Acetobacter nitrogenifigens DSM 23921 = NBRC 105050]
MKLLHIDSSILADHSVSRGLSRAITAKFVAEIPGLEVSYRDLAADPIQHLSGGVLAAQGSEGEPDQALKDDVTAGGVALQQFLEADIVVVGVGFYNLSVSSQLKAWIDRVVVAGKTFRYTEAGPEGLAGGKRVILAISRGGFYGEGSPNAAFEHGESYLRAVFGLLGVTQLEVIAADGVARGPEQRATATKAAQERIAVLAA